MNYVPPAPPCALRVREGALEERKGGDWTRVTASVELPHDIKDADVACILGAPALAEAQQLDASAVDDGRCAIAGCEIGGTVYFVREDRVKNAGGVLTEFAVFKGHHAPHQIGRFQLRENLYNFYLEQVAPVSARLLAISLISSRHPHENALVLFDVAKAQAIGYREFSKIRYISDQNAFWLVDPVANSDNVAEALVSFEQRAEIIPILVEGSLNPKLAADSELINKAQ